VRIKTGNALNIVLKEAIASLNDKGHIWIYPEGGRTKDGNLQQGKRGVAYLHQQTKAPIVPVYVEGTFGILSFKTLFRTRKVIIHIGQPIYSLGDVSLEQGVDKVMLAISELIK